MIIGMDMDDTLYDFVSLVLYRYNNKYKDNVKIEDITEWDIHKFLKPECKNVFREFVTEDLFKDVVVPKETKEFVSKIRRKHTVYFVTAGHPKTIQARDRLLRRNFKSFKSERLIVCREKQLLRLHVLIDDCEEYFASGLYRTYKGCMRARPWNSTVDTPTDIVRFNNYKELSDLLFL